MENNRPATIQSITVNGTVYNSFVVPSQYDLSRLGIGGHDPNGIMLNSVSTFITLPIICGNVSDEEGNPLQNVNINSTGDDGSTFNTVTVANGDYKIITEIDDINDVVNF